MALIAGHVAVLNRLAPLDPSHWKETSDPLKGFPKTGVKKVSFFGGFLEES